MTGATRTEICLVLQGGGALGAYEYGAILALFDLMDEARSAGKDVVLKAVTGVSIGAINAACIVGASDRKDARKRLDALWTDFMISPPPFVPPAISNNLALFYVPNFYTFQPGWTYLYNTQALLRTLSEHVDFALLNGSETAFVVTAVDVEGGKLASFANRQVGDIAPRTIKAQHVLASCSLAPQFPWTDVAESDGSVRHYWDGGIVDNTPLGAAIDAFAADPGVGKLLVVMDLFPLQSRLPQNYTEVSERVDQLRFGNRLRQDTSTAKQFNELIAAVKRLAALVPALPADLHKVADTYKFVAPVEIALGPQDSLNDPYGFRDFSQEGIEQRRERGRAIALDKLRPYFTSGNTA
jgi:NTE family protein